MEHINLKNMKEIKFADGFILQYKGQVWVDGKHKNDLSKDKPEEYAKVQPKHDFTVEVEIGGLTLQNVFEDIILAKTSPMVKAASRIRLPFETDKLLEDSEQRIYRFKLNELVERQKSDATKEKEKKAAFKAITQAVNIALNTLKSLKIPVTKEVMETIQEDLNTKFDVEYVEEWFKSWDKAK